MKELDRRTDYTDICRQDGKRIVELKTLAEQLIACDGCDTPLNIMNIEQERCTGLAVTYLFAVQLVIYLIQLLRTKCIALL